VSEPRIRASNHPRGKESYSQVDQWGIGRAFACEATACGVEVNVYVRPKIGFCKCATGVDDDDESRDFRARR